MSTTPPGWYQDPHGRAQLRWWSGTEWTSQVSTNGQQFEDPPVAPTTTAPAVAVPPVVAPSAAVSHTAVPPAVRARSGVGWGVVALAAVAALLAGTLLGYVVRGGGDDGGSASVSTDGDRDTDTGGTDTGGTDTGDDNGNATHSLADPLFKGLANLDSFEFRLSFATVGPTAADTATTETSGSRDATAKTSYQKMTSTTTADGETDVSNSESWRVDDVVCTLTPDSDPPYESEERNPFELDIAGTMPGILDLVLVSDNAQLVGTEQLAGVEVEHYVFTIDGLGQGSGEQVTANSGEMWVATDGDYIVKYQAKAGLRTAPEGTAGAELFELNISFELTSVNQPVNIALPAGCPPPSTDTQS